jgi:hypothetical protein
MSLKKLTILQKWYLKYTNKTQYKKYKIAIQQESFSSTKSDEYFAMLSANITHPSLENNNRNPTTFLHSGNCGDIIYALPTILTLKKNGKASIFLNTSPKKVHEVYHTSDYVSFNDEMAKMLIPLLLFQPEIVNCEIFNGQNIDYDLDIFRSYTFFQDRGSISRWYFYIFGISAPLYNPWLVAPKDISVSDCIIIARSKRYRNPLIDYSFLKKYPNLIFIGIEEEYDDIKLIIPSIKWRKVVNFLEMASLINGCKFFVGNQSFPFSLAEGLKVNRLLEVYYKIPNVIVEGSGANDFMYQPQFESLVESLYNKL